MKHNDIGAIKRENRIDGNANIGITTYVHCCEKMAQEIHNHPYEKYSYCHDLNGKTIDHYFDVKTHAILKRCPFCGRNLQPLWMGKDSDAEIFEACERERRRGGL